MLLPNGFDPDPRVHQEAKSLVKNGFDVTIIAWDRECKMPKIENKDGINIERIHIKSSYGRGSSQLFFVLFFWFKAFLLSMRKQFDVIHCHDFNTLPLGVVIGKLKRKKIIFDAHESYFEMLESNVSSIIKKAMATAEKNLLKRIDLLITVGEILESEYKRRGAKKTSVVGNWKLISDYQIPSEELIAEKQRLKLPDKLIITFIGYLNEGRGILELIEAAKVNKEIFVILAGKGMLEEQVKQAAKDCDNIIFLGFLSPETIPLYTALSDVIYYALNGRNPNAKYSAPNKLFEALAAGKVIITGNFGEIGKIVREENCGIIVDDITPTNLTKVLSLISQREILRNYQKNAAAAGKRKYNWLSAEQTLLDAYRHLS